MDGLKQLEFDVIYVIDETRSLDDDVLLQIAANEKKITQPRFVSSRTRRGGKLQKVHSFFSFGEAGMSVFTVSFSLSSLRLSSANLRLLAVKKG